MDAGASRMRLAVGVAAGLAGAAALALLMRRGRRGLRVARLVVYPVKGCKGVSVRRAVVQAEGLEHDREFMLVKPGENSDGSWVFVSQRSTPVMALIEPRMPNAEGELIVKAPGMEDFVIKPPNAGARRISTDVWGDAAEGLDCGDEAAKWFAQALKEPDVRLLKHVGVRKIDEKFAQGVSRFSDGYPLLVTSEASLMNAERRTGLGLSLQRFRPNLVLTGCDDFAEDAARGVACGQDRSAVTLRFVKPCSRCQVPSVDPTLGKRGKDPIRELKSYRSGRVMKDNNTAFSWHFEQHLGETFFGQNAVPDVAAGSVSRSIAVGDAAVWL